MERLTYDVCLGGNHCWMVHGADNLTCDEVCEQQGDSGCENCPIKKAFDKLAAYEDTGLEPGEIEAVAGLASENCAKTAAAIDRLLADEKIVKTRGDRIRAMPDEELARQFGAQCPKKVKRVCDKRCHLCWLDWLQQPSEDGVS